MSAVALIEDNGKQRTTVRPTGAGVYAKYTLSEEQATGIGLQFKVPAGAAGQAGVGGSAAFNSANQVMLELGETGRADELPPIGVIQMDDTRMGNLLKAFQPVKPFEKNDAAHVDIEVTGKGCWSMGTSHIYANFFFIHKLFVTTKVNLPTLR